MDKLTPGFYWLRAKSSKELTVARVGTEDDEIELIGDDEQWDLESLKEEFDVIGPIDQPKQ